jgi:two-component system, LytTR family, sensor kinase
MKSSYITILLHILVWSAVLLLPYFFAAPESHYSNIGFLQCNYFTLTNIAHIGLFYFNAFFLCPRFLNRRRWWLFLMFIAAIILFFYVLKLLILQTWFPVLAGDKDAFAFTFFPTVFFIVISTIFGLVVDKIDLEKEQLAMKLKFLRSQVNPHFLFNVLNNLVSMARHKSDRLEPSLIKLSGLMRYMLYDSDEKKIPVDVELNYLKNYIDLQELRFEGDVIIQTNISHDDGRYLIEPMLLIPFVENAFKHGITVNQKPVITIDLNMADGLLKFKVQNKVDAENYAKDNSSGIGLNNVKTRLNLLYPKAHELNINNKDGVFGIDLLLKLK